VHEIKFDGYRMAARIDGGKVQLLTRSGLDWTAKYPATAAAFAKLPVKTAYIDGELCRVRADGVTSFELMQQSASRCAGPATVSTRARSPRGEGPTPSSRARRRSVPAAARQPRLRTYAEEKHDDM
jgi:hypothetical protein